MAVVAAVMTGPGNGAIATIQLFGDSASAILRQVFVPVGPRPPAIETGQVQLGHVTDRGRVMDQVTVGCEGSQTFCIHCHGNPLIVEAIVKRLQDLGVKVVSAPELLSTAGAAEVPHRLIAVEARLALTTVKTLAGATLINSQVDEGLTAKALHWQGCCDSELLELTRREVRQVLADSRTARLIIEGCTIALIGPPNSGKSTLLNALAGREKAIVTDVQGTTRDWVSAEIHIPPLFATVIDTAGLDSIVAAEGVISKAAQDRSVEMLQQADLVLLVLDGSRPADQIGAEVFGRLVGKKTVLVLNKNDLPSRLPAAALPAHLPTVVRICAKQGAGIADLIASIHGVCGVADFDLHRPIAFTSRQYVLLEQLSSADSPERSVNLVTELLHGV